METQILTGLEMVMVAAGMLIERHRIGPGEALHEITECLRGTDRPAADVARDMIVRADPGVVEGPPAPRSADDPRMARPSCMPAISDGAGSEAVALAVGILVERHGHTVAEAVQAFVARRSSRLSDPVAVAWEIVDDAAAQRRVHD